MNSSLSIPPVAEQFRLTISQIMLEAVSRFVRILMGSQKAPRFRGLPGNVVFHALMDRVIEMLRGPEDYQPWQDSCASAQLCWRDRQAEVERSSPSGPSWARPHTQGPSSIKLTVIHRCRATRSSRP